MPAATTSVAAADSHASCVEDIELGIPLAGDVDRGFDVFGRVVVKVRIRGSKGVVVLMAKSRGSTCLVEAMSSKYSERRIW